jgi:hypothetical protein
MPGLLAVRGVNSLDTRYVSEDGRPLLTAAQLSELYGIRQRTVYQWRRRGYLARRGLTEDGQELYDAGEVASVMSRPRQRQHVTSLTA